LSHNAYAQSHTKSGVPHLGTKSYIEVFENIERVTSKKANIDIFYCVIIVISYQLFKI